MRTPTGLQGSKGGLLSPDLPTLRIPLDPSEGCKGWSQHERTAEYGEPQPRNHSTSTINARCSGMGSGTGATAGIRRSQENTKETQFPAFRDRAGTKRPNTGPDQLWFRTC
ncbi:hypothetical protein FA13DRAFT_1733240 [Coprinellus micaceus]|uniref:Uncharacterized protein n=1 Tax=Coprinellus micaceus TaxID=71717 RepID=A0A4Y7T9H2_COPMI|nr:hypothetical protein FA13DRAFT_1733240 [Coprinellus micaceus]